MKRKSLFQNHVQCPINSAPSPKYPKAIPKLFAKQMICSKTFGVGKVVGIDSGRARETLNYAKTLWALASRVKLSQMLKLS